jgi:hypothetical protein
MSIWPAPNESSEPDASSLRRSSSSTTRVSPNSVDAVEDGLRHRHNRRAYDLRVAVEILYCPT